ncbi:MAG: hypothetical protein ACON5J_19070 [Rubripirellula sp.]
MMYINEDLDMKIMTLQLLAGEMTALTVLVASLLKLFGMPLYSEEPAVEIQETAPVEQPVEFTEVGFPVIMWAGQINEGKSYEIPQGAILPVLRNQGLFNGVKLN